MDCDDHCVNWGPEPRLFTTEISERDVLAVAVLVLPNSNIWGVMHGVDSFKGKQHVSFIEFEFSGREGMRRLCIKL